MSWGPITIDHVFLMKQNSLYYLFHDTGGSAWNVLSNLSYLKHETKGKLLIPSNIPIKSKPLISHAIKSYSTDFNVDLIPISNWGLKNIRRYFQIIDLSKNKHFFPVSCPICGLKLRNNFLNQETKNNKKVIDIILKEVIQNSFFYHLHLDFINSKLISLLSSIIPPIHERLFLSVDLGFFGVKWLTCPTFSKIFSLFDFIFMPEYVENIIEQKCGNIKSKFMKINTKKPKMVVITRGNKGFKYFYINNNSLKMNNKKFLIDKNSYVVDDCGAGDAFIAKILSSFYGNAFFEIKMLSYKNIDLLEQIFLEAHKFALNSLKFVGAKGHLRNRKLEDVMKNNKHTNLGQNTVSSSKDCPVCKKFIQL